MDKTRKCYKCKKEISYREKKCPWCNATQVSPILWFVVLAVLIVSIFTMFQWSNKAETTIKPILTIEQKIEKQFTAWDGSHIKLKQYIKDQLKDPKSFEHIKTTYTPTPLIGTDGSQYITVNMEYRAKNSFWGYLVDTYKAYFDIEGNPFNIGEWSGFESN